jgi:CelD/BcsL family acetyltransferase involved in cellulose biosynthesis
MNQGDAGHERVRSRVVSNGNAASHRSRRVVTSLDQTSLSEGAWNRLAALGTNSVFQTHQWHQSWWSSYGPLYEPLFVVVSNGSGVSGVAPLYVEETVQGRSVRFLGDGRSDYCDLLAGGDERNVAAMIDAVCDYGRWDVMDLRNIPADSKTADIITADCRRRRLPVMVREQYACPTLLIRGREAEAGAILAKPSLRRRQRRLEKMGRLACRDLSRAADVAPYLDRFFEQHVARWSTTGTPSLFMEPLNRQFYRELTARLDGTSWLLFSLVELDDRPIAFHYGFDCQDSQIWYKPSYDPALAACSPGLVQVHHLIARAIAHGRREFDFTVGAEPFKLRFTNHVRKTVHVQIFRDYARYAFERSKRSVIETVRRLAGPWAGA